MKWPGQRAGSDVRAVSLSRPQISLVPEPAPAIFRAVDSPQSESSRWFVEEVQPHEPVLRSYLRGSFPAVHDIDDVVQESYLRVWKARAAQPVRCAKAFLFTVARHIALNLTARERRSPIFAVGDLAALTVVEERTGVTDSAEKNETLRLLVQALATLPPRCREVTVLRKLRGLSQKEVAAALGIAEKTVDEHLARGVRRCEAYLRKHGVTRPPGS